MSDIPMKLRNVIDNDKKITDFLNGEWKGATEKAKELQEIEPSDESFKEDGQGPETKATPLDIQKIIDNFQEEKLIQDSEPSNSKLDEFYDQRKEMEDELKKQVGGRLHPPA